MPTITLPNGMTATVKNGVWLSKHKQLVEWLSLDIPEPPASQPGPDNFIALAVAKELGATVSDLDPPDPDFDPEVIY